MFRNDLKIIAAGEVRYPDAAVNWVGTVPLHDAVPAMPEIGIELPVRDPYVNVELPPPEADD